MFDIVNMLITNHGAMLRLHRVAGLIVAPFMIMAALTGFFYALAPTLESAVYHEELTASARPDGAGIGQQHSLDKQVRAARFVEPDLPVAKVQPSDDPDMTTRVLFSDESLPSPSYTRAVFVDPYDLHVTGEMVQYGSNRALPLRTWLSEGHRTLWLGQPGRIYCELAASWLGALSLLGIYLWLKRLGHKRSRERAGAAVRREKAALRWHSWLGAWLLPGALFLTITGLTWSMVAGGNISTVREQLNWLQPTPSVAIAQDAGAPVAAPDAHAEHHHSGGATTVFGAQKALEAAREEGLTGILDMAPPPEAGQAWTVTEARQPYKMANDAVSVDPHSGAVTDRVDFADWPLAAKVVPWLIQLHMGILFGIYSQVALALLALGLLAVTLLGVWMWFCRPRRSLPALKASPALIAGAVAYSILAPLFGASLVLFFAVDWAVRRIRGGARAAAKPAREKDPAPARV